MIETDPDKGPLGEDEKINEILKNILSPKTGTYSHSLEEKARAEVEETKQKIAELEAKIKEEEENKDEPVDKLDYSKFRRGRATNEDETN